MSEKTELQRYIAKIWEDHCDLDYWINDMENHGTVRIPNNVLKMAMKHLRTDLYATHKFLCRLEARNDEMMRAHRESTRED